MVSIFISPLRDLRNFESPGLRSQEVHLIKLLNLILTSLYAFYSQFSNIKKFFITFFHFLIFLFFFLLCCHVYKTESHIFEPFLQSIYLSTNHIQFRDLFEVFSNTLSQNYASENYFEILHCLKCLLYTNGCNKFVGPKSK